MSKYIIIEEDEITKQEKLETEDVKSTFELINSFRGVDVQLVKQRIGTLVENPHLFFDTSLKPDPHAAHHRGSGPDGVGRQGQKHSPSWPPQVSQRD